MYIIIYINISYTSSRLRDWDNRVSISPWCWLIKGERHCDHSFYYWKWVKSGFTKFFFATERAAVPNFVVLFLFQLIFASLCCMIPDWRLFLAIDTHYFRPGLGKLCSSAIVLRHSWRGVASRAFEAQTQSQSSWGPVFLCFLLTIITTYPSSIIHDFYLCIASLYGIYTLTKQLKLLQLPKVVTHVEVCCRQRVEEIHFATITLIYQSTTIPQQSSTNSALLWNEILTL